MVGGWPFGVWWRASAGAYTQLVRFAARVFAMELDGTMAIGFTG